MLAVFQIRVAKKSADCRRWTFLIRLTLIRLRKQHLCRRFFPAIDAFSARARLGEGNAPDGRLGFLFDPVLGGPIGLEEGADEAAVFLENLFHVVVACRVARVCVSVCLCPGEECNVGLIEALAKKPFGDFFELENLLRSVNAPFQNE